MYIFEQIWIHLYFFEIIPVYLEGKKLMEDTVDLQTSSLTHRYKRNLLVLVLI